MSEGFLAGLLVGLLAGGSIAILAVALVTVGSDRGLIRPSRESPWVAGATSPSAQTWVESSMRIDLLLDLHDADRYAKRLAAHADDIEQEMRELVRRYGMPSGS
jgi:hypothetical protein